MLHRLYVLTLLFTTIAMAQPRSEFDSTACRPVDTFSTGLRDYLVQLDTSADSVDVDQRIGFGLPAVPVSSIAIQTDSLTCERAATAYYSRLASPPSNRAVAVVRMGSVYVVGDPRVTVGEFTGYAVFDTTFTVNMKNFAG